MDELADMKRQRHSVSFTIDALNKDVDKYSLEAEGKEDITILSNKQSYYSLCLLRRCNIQNINVFVFSSTSLICSNFCGSYMRLHVDCLFCLKFLIVFVEVI